MLILSPTSLVQQLGVLNKRYSEEKVEAHSSMEAMMMK